MATLAGVPEVAPASMPEVVDAALRSIRTGRDLYTLSQALVAAGLTEAKAGEVALHVHNRSTSAMEADRQGSLGVTEAVWLYSGAPCYSLRGGPHLTIWRAIRSTKPRTANATAWLKV